MTLLSALRDFFQEQGLKKTYWVAYSGGLDSHVLLSLCHALHLELGVAIRVIHINHGISPHANQWERHCAAVCKDLVLPYVSRTIAPLKFSTSLENNARMARYGILAEYIETSDDVLLTAHHQDDQAETLFLQLLRGAGPKGLSAMPFVKPFAKGMQARPLLHFPRASLEAYGQALQLTWVQDESNTDTQLTRNFIRHTILSPLKARLPNVTETLARSAKHCAESQALLEDFAVTLCKEVQGSQPHTLSIQKLQGFNEERQRLILRTWIYQQGYPLPDTKKLKVIQTEVCQAASDRMPHLVWQDVEVRRFGDDLHIMRCLPPHDTGLCLEWNLKEPVTLPGGSTWHAIPVRGKGLTTAISSLCIKFRQGGEVINLAGRGRRTLKNLFQEWGIPTWERQRIPLLFVGEELVGVAGHAIDARFMAKPDEPGWDITSRVQASSG